MKAQRFAGATALVFLLLLGASVAHAAPAPTPSGGSVDALGRAVLASPNPEDALSKLDPSTRAALEDWATVDSVEAIPSPLSLTGPALDLLPVVAAYRCYTGNGTVVGKNAAGVAMWSYSQDVEWCTDGTRVVSGALKDAYAEMFWPTWRFHDHVSHAGALTTKSYTSALQGKFSQGAFTVSLEYVYVCNSFIGYLNGSSATQGSQSSSQQTCA